MERREYNSLYPLAHDEEHCAPGHFWGPGIRPHYIIHYVVSGRGRLCHDGHEFVATAGQIFVIFPWTVIKYEADMKDPWHYTWINFYGNEAEEIFSQLGLSPTSPLLDLKNGDEVLEVMRKMPTERGADVGGNLDFSARLYDLMSLIVKNREESDRGENIYLTAAKRYIKAHYFEDITVERIAYNVGISRKYLFSIFKSYLGVSPKDYMVEYRMRRAEEFLCDTNIHVSNVAYSVGYKDPLTFSKMFKLKRGVWPTEYRRMKAARAENDKNS